MLSVPRTPQTPVVECASETPVSGKRSRSRPRKDEAAGPKLELACCDHGKRLLAGFAEMFASRPFADVTVIVADQQFEAHRLVLASASDFFRWDFLSMLAEAAKPLGDIRDTDVFV